MAQVLHYSFHSLELDVDVPDWFPGPAEVKALCETFWPGLWPAQDDHPQMIEGRVTIAIRRLAEQIEHQRRPQPVAVWGLWSHVQAVRLLRECVSRYGGLVRLPHKDEERLVGCPHLSADELRRREKWLASIGGICDL